MAFKVKRIAQCSRRKGIVEECNYVSAPKKDANSILAHLLKNDLVRKDLKIRYELGKVLIPVKEEFPLKQYKTSWGAFKERDILESPVDQIMKRIQSTESDKKIPDKFIRLGKALVFKESRTHIKWSRELLEATAEQFGVDSIYVDSGIGSKVTREPSIELIYGPGGDVIHREGEIRYRFDPSRVMFSPGNVNARLSKRNENFDGKVVLDMFAGIGYFSLQAGSRSKNSTIYACEINPVSFRYLRENIESNALGKTIKPILGDCRDIPREIVADEIIMGHFDCLDYLSVALLHSKKGTVIDMHMLLDTRNLETGYKSAISAAYAFGYTLDYMGKDIVKSYGPHLWHISVKLKVTGIKI